MKCTQWMLAVVTSLLFVGFSPLINASDTTQVAATESAARLKVNVNQADAQTLADRLTGIGIKRAQAIVSYRERHGRFNTADDLLAVKGVGMSVLEKNAGLFEF